MRLFACKLLADENIHPQVVQALNQQGCDIVDVPSLGLTRRPDEIILDEAHQSQRILLTHDRDFGRLAILARKPIYGIVFIRPGHIDPSYTLATLHAVEAQEFDFSPSFILVARRRGLRLQLRLRRW